MPLLEILTRCYRRPGMLALNQASIDAQADDDWVQTLLVDGVGRGVAWANANLGAYAAQLEGDYVWVLDDDDLCIADTLIADLRGIVEAHHPDAVMVRMDHGPRGILPDDTGWGRRDLQEGQVGCSGYIVRRAVWQSHARAWSARYAGDYDFIAALLSDAKVSVYWHDIIASRTQAGSNLGRAEAQ